MVADTKQPGGQPPGGYVFEECVFDVTETDNTLAASIAEALKPDPATVGIIFSNTGGQPLALSTKNTVSLTTGLLLAANSDPLQITRELYASLVQQAWYAISNSTGTTLHVIRVKRIR